jgi:oligopeptide transport system substrate-binding protein
MRFLVFFFVGSLASSLVSCGEYGSGHKQDDRTVFRYNEAGGISSLDPAQSRNLENIWAVNMLFNGLVQMNEDMEVQPSIASSYEISEDGTIYTFHLRTDVYFHDHELFADSVGRKVVADDFVYSFFRIIDPELPSPGAVFLSALDKTERGDYRGFKAENDSTFTVFLTQPFQPFLGILTMKYFSVVPHEVAENYGIDFRRNPCGTGPFKFKIWKEGVKLVVVGNEKYFEKDGMGKSLPYIDAVSVSFVQDRTVAFFNFLRGKYDFMSGIDGGFRDEALTKTGELKPAFKEKCFMQTEPFLKTDYLGIMIDDNLDATKNNPLTNRAVRQAINYGINRDELITYMRNGIGTRATGFIPLGIPGYDPERVKGYEYNPEKAARLLFEAGYENGENMPEITLTTTSAYKDLAEVIQDQLDEISITINIDVVDESQARFLIATSQVNFFRKSWVADYLDAENFLQLFYSKNFSPEGSNYFHFSNQYYDHLYEKAISEQDPERRYSMYAEMDSIILEEAPVVPLYYDEVVHFVSHDVEGLASNPMNLLDLKRVRKKSAKVVAEAE